MINADHVRALLKNAAGDNARAWCETHGAHPSVVSEVLSGRREPTPAVLKALRLERVTMYRQAPGKGGSNGKRVRVES